MTDLAPCGTPAAHQRHYVYGEQPCEDCRQAWNEYYAAWRSANRDNLVIDQAGRLVAVTTQTGRPVSHGINCYLMHGCRCPEAIKAYETYYLTETHRQRGRTHRANKKHNARIIAQILRNRQQERLF